MSNRRHISTRERTKIFADAGGKCHICGQIIKVGEKWEAEHVIPLAQGGADHWPNIQPAHKVCHPAKTKKDAADTAKAKRREAIHTGSKAPTRNPIPSRQFDKKERKPKVSLAPRALYEDK